MLLGSVAIFIATTLKQAGVSHLSQGHCTDPDAIRITSVA